jgi:hypothetical protein
MMASWIHKLVVERHRLCQLLSHPPTFAAPAENTSDFIQLDQKLLARIDFLLHFRAIMQLKFAGINPPINQCHAYPKMRILNDQNPFSETVGFPHVSCSLGD